MSLKVYNRKRNFSETPEPPGQVRRQVKKGAGPLRFVIQKHQASRLHYDFRLEFDGVYKSWAVPKGPSLSPLEQRLAVFVEDHPLDYGTFEGIIPSGNYGAGTVMLWDQGTYTERSSENRKQSEAAMKKGLAKGHLTFVLEGQKLKGEFALVKLRKSEDKAWLLIKKRDEFADYKQDIRLKDRSVKTGRSLEKITAEASEAGDIWLSKRKKTSPPRPRLLTPKKGSNLPRPDPMPRKNKPMVATPAHQFKNQNWIFEKKTNGLRALAEIEGRTVRLYSRSGLPFEKKFPKIVEELKTTNIQAALDGEIVTQGKTSTYQIFDILYSSGRDLRKRPLKERKKLLSSLPIKGKYLQVAEIFREPRKIRGPMIAKNPESPYRPGTSSDWLVLDKSSTTAQTKKNSDEPQLTHLEKIYWPNEGITKGDLLNYYDSIAPYILPYLKDRPQSLNRHPNGITAPGFYQKDMTGHIPRWLKTERIFSESADKSIDYVVCQDKRSLLYIVNLGCIEINPWFSRIGHLDNPDFLVIDLDPDGNPFNHVIEIAHEFRKIFDRLGAKSFCKTSGATGIHIGVPTGARYDFDSIREFAEDICKVIEKKFPATTSTQRNPQRRQKKIYLDFMQNRRGQTLAAPFCVRPRAGAPVSMPLAWDELKPGLEPSDFNLHNALKIIQKKKDPWKGLLGAGIDLTLCSKNLKKHFNI